MTRASSIVSAAPSPSSSLGSGRPSASCASASSTSGVPCAIGPGVSSRSVRALATGWGRRARLSFARLRLRATEHSRQVSAFRDALCGTCTSDSTSAAGFAPGCSACFCSFGSSGACTLHRRASQLSGRLHEPSRRFRSGDDLRSGVGPQARKRTPPGAGSQCSVPALFGQLLRDQLELEPLLAADHARAQPLSDHVVRHHALDVVDPLDRALAELDDQILGS